VCLVSWVNFFFVIDSKVVSRPVQCVNGFSVCATQYAQVGLFRSVPRSRRYIVCSAWPVHSFIIPGSIPAPVDSISMFRREVEGFP